MNSSYFDNLDIENYFDTNNSFPTYTPGLISTNPQRTSFETNGQSDATPNHPERQNADGKLHDKLKKFVHSKQFKTILKIEAIVGGVAILIVFGPEIIAALTPVLPAMKALLQAKGVATKGPADVIKQFHVTQVGDLPKDGNPADNAKKVVTAILKFFKNAHDRKVAGTQSPLDDKILTVADDTIQKISDGTVSVESLTNDPSGDKGTTPTKTGATGEEKKTGIDMKIVLIAIVAIFLISK